MDNVLFITGATNTYPYNEHLGRLTKSMEEHQLTYIVYKLTNLGTWVLNAQQKATCIKMALQSYRFMKGVVWLDVDCVVKQYPSLFNNLSCDFACHYLNGELLSGTLYFATSIYGMTLVESWITMMEARPTTFDQKVLQEVVTEMRRITKIKVYQLPATYVQIFDIMKEYGEPVIEHYQASREGKRVLP